MKLTIKNKKISISSLFLGDAKSPSIGLKDILHLPIKETTKDREGRELEFLQRRRARRSSSGQEG
ncbi:hypothetical protein GRI99_18435 [Altererythrobacter buctensis]|uniref:Uncharacterized protein n=1 Tax=Alteraurantiacibacter buctensis TaxID=1503981 RepID=A0A844YZ46_9SPHN|nr:hypothetical protein [Alteraurantiacibacter buctensis]